MSSENKDVNGDLSSSGNEEASLTSNDLVYLQSPATSRPPNKDYDMKRNAVKALIERYFYQLQSGCGNPKCSNSFCASSGKVAPMTPNEIAAKALQLVSQEAKLCDFDNHLAKIARTQNDSPTTSSNVSSATTPSKQDSEMMGSNEIKYSEGSGMSALIRASSSSSTVSTNTNISSCATEEEPIPHIIPTTSCAWIPHNIELNQNVTNPPKSSMPTQPPIDYLDNKILEELIEESTLCNNFERLTDVIKDVFGDINKLSKSFMRSLNQKDLNSRAATSKIQALLSKSPKDLKKEDLRILEGETEKDEDSSVQVEENVPTLDVVEPMNTDEVYDDENTTFQSNRSDTMVDLESLRQIKNKLFDLDKSEIRMALNEGISTLIEKLKFSVTFNWENVLHCFVILFDMPFASSTFADMEYIDRNLPKLCSVARILPVSAQARLARIWATNCSDLLLALVQCCQQLITIQTMFDEEMAQENQEIISVTKILKIAFYANILASELDTRKSLDSQDVDVVSTVNEDEDDIFNYMQEPKGNAHKFAEDPLEKELGISSLDCRVPLVPLEEFYNEAFSEIIQMDRDYMSYRNLSFDPNGPHFSFMLYSFILTPATKVIALYYDSRIRMFSERNLSLYTMVNYNSESNHRPDLKLRINRDNIISDALIWLEMVAMSNPKDLKKQLVVEFIGEQGIDEGGVSKEFFQLIVEEIFNPDFGMFTQQKDTNYVWFNTSPYENDAQFTLVGILLGLAIYNNIILAVNFPMVVYRKLMGGVGTFYDLKDWSPSLYSGLKSMLDYEEMDMEDTFMQTFQIRYNNVFGEVVEHDLRLGGSEIIVNQQNKQEFVDLYCDFLLNKSIEKQFKAFKKGFEMVTDESPLKLLFRPEEVEMLVCGSRKFDFNELEKSTEYEGGYSKETQIIKDFWNIVHSMPEEAKRKLLEFTTGSDRVPVGGLSRLKLLITRNGPDTDRLPTSHTCFNVLLLPEYNSKEKLEERLLKAINYSKGFGML
ncbi:ubiquitin-protein ligase E3A isoform X2 [Teleopsis dalmanni]|uniref:ubiquitin-protein ligase E3A-like isoform X2 n=1 Tax=Teleopsis dalmanni TaxID=139649 RepID=UPI0018CDD5EE|nr:ubiquitin-protein ligase E3A-like isoform X2 [Teleopsis dalmanni]XP_037948935.1 ubiquitin-protein ligase E3A isoform X2 [Teleopsis dalmanni]